MEKALRKLEAKCKELGWNYEKVKMDFELFLQYSDHNNEEDAVIEYVEETEQQGLEF